MDWLDGPAFIGWGSPLTDEERRKMHREDAVWTTGCILAVLVILAVFGIGIYATVHWFSGLLTGS